MTELVDLVGCDVELTLADENGGDNDTFDARIEQVNEYAIVYRRKGKRGSALELAQPARLIGFKEKDEAPKQLRGKRIKPVTVDKVRRHLLDMHFFSVDEINSLTERQAFDAHELIDHEGMGHDHTRGLDGDDDGDED